jgi:lipopolysaccharide export system protein LptA
MKPNKLCECLSICLILSGFYGTAAHALETDSEQPITIDSNTATYDDKTAISIYTGDVISIQGSIKVNSDKLVVYFVDGDAEKLVFTGNPAHFKQTPSPGKEDIIGDALIGEYYPKKNLLILKNNATVKQGNGTYKSDYIEYDIQTSLVKAGDKSTDSKRVRVTLQPKAKAKK